MRIKPKTRMIAGMIVAVTAGAVEAMTGVATAGPVVTRLTLRSYPKPQRGEIFTVPLLLHEVVVDRTGSEVKVDVMAALEDVLRLQETRSLVVYQVGSESHTVLVDDSVYVYGHRTQDGKAWNGTCSLRLKRLSG